MCVCVFAAGAGCWWVACVLWCVCVLRLVLVPGAVDAGGQLPLHGTARLRASLPSCHHLPRRCCDS